MALEWYFERSAENLLPVATARLHEAGFRVQWTFDLHTARELAPNCTCPSHGTTRCDCQYMVLLVSRDGEAPETLLVHGHDRQSWVVLAEQPDRHPNEDVQRIVRLLHPVEAAVSRESIDVA